MSSGLLVTPPPTTTADGWKPHEGPQELALMQPTSVFEILYGGARGGGKTDAGLAWMSEYMNHPRFRGLVLRRNVDDLSDWLDRAEFMYKPYGVRVTRHPQGLITFKSGAKIRVGHLKDKNAYTKYQGHEYQKVLIEELTQIPKEAYYQNILSSARSTIPELRPQVFLTTNPGGVGHGWVKRRFIQPRNGARLQAGWPHMSTKTKRKAIFIPAKVDDNPTLIHNDPHYVNLLEGYKETDEQLYKAWRFGSWDVFVGQAFGEFSYDTHTIPGIPHKLSDCYKIMSFDWGYSANGVMTWIAVAPENKWGVQRVYVYRELVMNKTSPKEWAKRLKAINESDKRMPQVGGVEYMSLPHDTYSSAKGEKTIEQEFKDGTGIRVKRMPTLSKDARKNRKALLHSMFEESPDGKPYMQIRQSCNYLIETIPELVYDDTNTEDIDTNGEDHGYDAMTGGLLQLSQDGKTSRAVSTRERKPKLETRPSFITNKQGEVVTPDLTAAIARAKKRRGSAY